MEHTTIHLNNPLEVRMIGFKALKEALGPVGTVRFIQQYDLEYGDYTKERQDEPDISLDEIDTLLKIPKEYTPSPKDFQSIGHQNSYT